MRRIKRFAEPIGTRVKYEPPADANRSDPGQQYSEGTVTRYSPSGRMVEVTWDDGETGNFDCLFIGQPHSRISVL